MSSHWCYRCNRFVRLWRLDMPMCPECDSGFIEEIEHPTRSIHVEGRRRRFPTTAAMYMIGHNHIHNSNNNSRRRHCRNNDGDHSPFNPIIMLRGGTGGSSEGTSREGGESHRGFELYYDDGVGNGLRPLPPRMSEFLLGSGFERVMQQLSHVEANRSGMDRHDQSLPASKVIVECLPSIQINESHMVTESQCAVCKEAFEVGITAREMPCKHIYHPECILPWLAIRNSCPVCRHELPCESQNNNTRVASTDPEENAGLTIWRLPGGGFVVGRFSGGRRGGVEGEGEVERELPVVYTEVDGGLNIVGEPRRISWSLSSSSRGRRGSGGGLRRMLSSLFGCLRGGVRHQRSVSTTTREYSYSQPVMTLRSNSASQPVMTTLRSNSVSRTDVINPSPRSRRTWSMDVNSGLRPW